MPTKEQLFASRLRATMAMLEREGFSFGIVAQGRVEASVTPVHDGTPTSAAGSTWRRFVDAAKANGLKASLNGWCGL